MSIPLRYCLLVLVLLFANRTFAQEGFFTGLNGTVINVPCGTNCNNLKVSVPHLKTTSDYSVVPVPYTPFPFVTRTGNELLALYDDDRYSNVIDVGFPFCYYDSVFTKVVAGSNGLLTFDQSQATLYNSYRIAQPVPYAGGIPNSLTSAYYPPASIMGMFTDLDPSATESPADRKIEWRVEGNAPFRRFILSFYHLGTWGQTACTLNSPGRPTTFQIVLFESTGIIELYVEDKFCQPSTTSGRSIMGIQNWQRDKAVAVPGRNATSGWTATNEGWRFVPSGSVSRFARAEIYDLNGALLQTTTPADTATTTAGLLDINFSNLCFTGASKQFVVKSFFAACGSNQSIFSADTITVTKGNVTATTSTTPAACSPSGTATITIPPTTGPYTFTIGSNPPVTSASNTYTFTGLLAGNYLLTASNAAGCGGSANVTVAQSGVLNVLVTPRPTSCSGLNDGQILVTPQNGTAPYQYNINNGPYQPGNTFTNLAPATYVVGAVDASGCIVANQLVTITAGGPVTAASIQTTNVSCNNANNGSATVNLSANAVPPLQFSLDGINYQSSNTFSGLAAGNYTARFRDANNCSGVQNFTITQPSALVSAVATQNVLCNGQSSGKITINASGGTAGYQYSIDGINYQSANNFSVAAGSYTVYTKDGAGCIKTTDVTISQPTLLSLTAQTENASCNGGADGKITATAQGGTIGYVYSIDGSAFQASNVFPVLQNNYVVTVKDANGCTATANAVVGLTNNLTLSLSSDTTICQGTPAELLATTNATQVSWSNGFSLNNAGAPNPIALPSDTTKYVATAVLGACSVKDSLVVNVLPAPVADAGPDNEICFGQGHVLQGSGGVSYQWSPGTYFNDGVSVTAQNPATTPAQTIEYALTVTDANGCRSLTPSTVLITVTPPIRVNATPADTVVSRGDIIQLWAGAAVTSFSWSPAIGLDNPSSQNPVAIVDRDITYEVTAFTAAGCKGTDTVKIRVYNGPEVYVPTGFTPNGDGKNELLLPFPVGIKEVRYFRVFNRWGQVVFQTTALSQGWDGKVAGKEQPADTYVWALEVVTKENKIIRKRGTTVLIR